MRIESEIGKLRKVILHRPELALRRLTPTNCQELLFDDVLWPEKAAAEHKHFENTLLNNEVEVFILGDLLAQTLENSRAKDWVLIHTLKRLYHESDFSEQLYDFLSVLDAKTLANYLLGGLTWKEMDIPATNLLCEFMAEDSFVLPPLPNHYFTRDIASSI